MKRHENLPRKFPHVVKVGSAAATIYHGKTRGYDLFTVSHVPLQGGRIRKTFSSFEAARSEAQEVAGSIARGEARALSLKSPERASYVAACELLAPLGIPLHVAVEEYVAARNRAGKDSSLLDLVDAHVKRREKVTERNVADVVSEFIAARQSNDSSVRYIQTLRTHLLRFGASFQTAIGNVTTRNIDAWLSSLCVGPRARNNTRTSIVTLFRFARSKGYLPKGARTEAEDTEKAKDRGGAIGILAPDQMAKVMKHALPEHAVYFALGGFAGLRRAEIERLDWHDLNFERGHILVAAEKSKTATRRLVPIHPNLLEWLAPLRREQGPLVSSKRAGDAAIAFAKSKIGGEWPSNALRHSYATYRLAQIADSARVALEMGNSVAKLMTNYRELKDPTDAAAWFAITPKRPANVIALAAREAV